MQVGIHAGKQFVGVYGKWHEVGGGVLVACDLGSFIGVSGCDLLLSFRGGAVVVHDGPLGRMQDMIYGGRWWE